MLIPDVNPSAVIKAHFSSFNVFLSYLFQEKFNNGKQQQQKKEAYYCKHVTALFHKLYPRQALLGGAPSTCQVPARDYSITFQQEPRSFEIRKNKQHKMCQRGSPGTLKRREFSQVLSLAIIQNQPTVVLSGSFKNKKLSLFFPQPTVLLSLPKPTNSEILNYLHAFSNFSPINRVRIRPYVHKSGVLLPNFHYLQNLQ